MFNKFLATSLTILSMATPCCVHANDDSCEIQVAVSSPPVQPDQKVAFNINNDNGVSKSTILAGGDSSKIIGKLTCSPLPYTISATQYFTLPQKLMSQPIGECVLKAGPVILNGSNNSVTVVFPNDFICNY